eukprot:gb/GECG01015232.1/.p1 GENE.gb/GECG01015232.1/~~gb/GECG01015232.1/.p1  ORF type:complete len:393 (+),score=101.58 gb/GECG01015232.1/:1-1179(+)
MANQNDKSQLNPVDAQRSIALIEDAIEKLSFLGSLTPDIMAHRDELAAAVGEEITRLIEEQHNLEKRYEELTRQRSEAEATSTRMLKKQITDEIQSLSQRLRESTKQLSRNLKENPNVAENLRKISQERSDLERLLKDTISELNQGRYDSLLDYVNKEKAEQERLRRIEEEEKQTRQTVDELEQQVLSEQEDHENEMSKKQSQVEELQQRLRDLKLETTLQSRVSRRSAMAGTESKGRVQQLEEARLQKELDDLTETINREQRAHEEAASLLQKQQKELADRVSEWQQKKDAEIQAKQEEFQKLEQQRQTDKEELDKLLARYEEEQREQAERKQRELEEAKQKYREQKRREREHTAANQIHKVLKPAAEILYARQEVVKAQKAAKKNEGKKK